jgi:ribosomal protein S18 acetylase RimI-like enzyme
MQFMAVVLMPWQDLSPTDQAAVLQLSVAEHQVEFAGTVEQAVAGCEADKAGNVVGLAIRANEQIVGFLVLKRRSATPEWASPAAATVAAMRVGRGYQSKGLGSAALLALSDWIASKWPECESLCLSVDEGNTAGIRAYRKAGFQDQGTRVPGRIGYVRYMSKAIKASTEKAL